MQVLMAKYHSKIQPINLTECLHVAWLVEEGSAQYFSKLSRNIENSIVVGKIEIVMIKIDPTNDVWGNALFIVVNTPLHERHIFSKG